MPYSFLNSVCVLYNVTQLFTTRVVRWYLQLIVLTQEELNFYQLLILVTIFALTQTETILL